MFKDNWLSESHIMVVDDIADNLRLIESILNDKVASLRMFVRAKQAIESARLAPPDLFLLDIDMPEMNGYQLCELIKLDKTLRNIPVIFLSCFNSSFDKVKGFKVGGVDYLAKPFNTEELEARVSTHIQQYKLKQILTEKNTELSHALSQNEAMRHQAIKHEKLEAIAELIIGLAHEINTPLGSAITGSSVVMDHINIIQSKQKDKSLTSSDLKNAMRISAEAESLAMANLTKVSKLIDELRKLSEQNAPIFNPVDLHELITQVFTAKQQKHPDKQLNLNLSMTKPLMIMSNKSILTEILQELMKNSLLHNNDLAEFHLHISAEINTSALQLHYWDNGVMTKHLSVGKIFAPFYTTKRSPTNKGLGLYLVNHLTNRLLGNCNGYIHKNGALLISLKIPLNPP